MTDSFDVELRRITRALREGPAPSPEATTRVSVLLHALMAADSRARGLPQAASNFPAPVAASTLQAVAFDAAAAGVELETLLELATAARRTLTVSRLKPDGA